MVINNALTTFGAATGATVGAFPGLSVQKTNEIKNRSKTMSNDPFEQSLIQDDLYKSELANQNHQNFMQDRQLGRMSLDAQTINTKDPKTKNTSTSVKKMGALADMYRQYGYEHGQNWDSMGDEELISRFNTKNPQVKKLADAFLTGGEDSEYRLSQQLGITGSSNKNAREELNNNFWENTRGSMKTKASGTVDSWKKFGQRALSNIGGNIYKGVIKNLLGDEFEKMTGVSFDDYVNDITDTMVQNEVEDYQNKVNQAYEVRKSKNVDSDIDSYYEQKGYTKLLKEGDFKGFFYKAFGDGAENWDMPLIVAASVFQPEVGFALMATDTYARENQDAFETMINNGATYEEAEKGGVVVGLINAAVEVYLEKLLGGVETRASKGIRDIFTKNIKEEFAKQGFGKMLVNGLINQVKASGEEGLEEIVQQFVQNVAVKTVNENQDLFQGLGQAFEGGFYNPMNLLVGGSNIVSGVKNSRGMANQNTQTSVDIDDNGGTVPPANNIRQGILDRITDWGAQKITGTVSAQDKLYKAQEPRMNVLSNKKNLENRRVNSDRANQLIIENGYVPTNTTERLDAHQATLNKLWKQVMDQVNQGEGVTVDQTSMIDALSEYINNKKKLGIAGIESDIRALEAELESLQKMQEEGTTDLPILEAKKQVYNDLIDWKSQEASEVYKGGIKLLTQEIGKIEDNILSEIPGEFSNLKKDVGALLDTYEDVFKADMKNQRSKGMGLTETYSRIEGIGDTLGGIFQLFKGDASGVAKGLGKLALGKSLAKAKDVDFLIEQGFKELANQQGLDKNQASSKTAKYQVADENKLIGLRNTTLGGLTKTVEVGGMPMPSIAVTKRGVPHTDYGDITLIMKESAINPKLNSANKVHIVDGYTPEIPQPIIRLKETAEAEKIANRIQKETGISYGEFEQWIENKEQRERYHPEMAKYDKEYSEITEKKLWGGIDDNGRHYLDYNAENLVKQMLENKEDAYNGQFGKMVAQYKGDINDIEELRNREYGPKDEAKYDKLFDDYYNSVHELYEKVKNNDNFGGEGNFQEALAYEYDRDTNKWLQNLKDEYNYKDSVYMKLKKSDLDKLQKIIKEGASVVRPYSEAKPERAVKWDEIGAVVVPEENLSEVKKLLKDVGVDVYGYKEGERMAVVDRVADEKNLRFQRYGMANANEQNMTATEGLNISNFKNGKTVQELAKQYGIDTKIVDSISTPEGQRAYGMYGDRLITLAKDLKESTVPHELLHGVFDVVDGARRKSILDGVQKKLGVDNVQAEEWLADKFSEYYRTGTFGTQNLAKTFIEKVKQFFYKVKSYIDGTYNNEKQIRQLFDDIIDGKIEGEYGVYSDPRFQTVWHGSPYKFTKFDSSHMGEGEGAQAHGWGNYVAVDKNTAKKYAQMGKNGYEHNGTSIEKYRKDHQYTPFDERDAVSIAEEMVLNDMILNGNSDINELKEEVRVAIHNAQYESIQNKYKEVLDALDTIDLNKVKEIPGHHLYEVEIPDPIKKDTPTGSNYLEEDKIFTKSQINKLRDKIEKSGMKGGEQLSIELSYDIPYSMKLTGRQVYDKLAFHLRGKKAASKFLESLGYDGIHYFGGIDGEAYVIFNDDNLEIKNHEEY